MMLPREDLEASYAAAEIVTRHWARSFHFASAFLPLEKRRAVFAIYDYCRHADNLVDLRANATINRTPAVSFSGWTLYDVSTHTTIDSAASLISNGVEVDDLNLGAGTYTFELKGTFVQAKGTYTGYVSAQAVPEPAEAALLLAGLGLVGLVARRRKA